MNRSFECRQLTRHFGPRRVLTGVDWQVRSGSLTGLVGESGAGKTTLLRILAGLDRPTSGSLEVPSRKNVALVFQSLALWPHLSVRRHIEYVLPSLSRGERRKAAEEMLREVHLPAHTWESKPEQLSGGEAQRLALARAIAPQPELLLLDEPLAQVDMPLRQELIALVQSLARRRGTTVVYVSHSWTEIMELCDDIAVLYDGAIVQQGSLEEVYAKPMNATVACLTGPVVTIPLELLKSNRIAAASDLLATACRSEDDSAILIRPQQIHFGLPSESNLWQPVAWRPHGSGWLCTLTNQSSASTAGNEFELRVPSVKKLAESVSLHLSSN